MRFEELRCKEIINVNSGHRLGYVCDAEVELPSGCVKALIVPGPARFFGLFGREPDFLIPMGCVKKLGRDIILVEISGAYDRDRRERKRFF
ncbi:MAG: YlmC/YmxH family sporulation protein [Oscillospiraceae bacterium]|nr:YlmC/YmxH family sporulation protein [Oscillospiraceae bacterium]